MVVLLSHGTTSMFESYRPEEGTEQMDLYFIGSAFACLIISCFVCSKRILQYYFVLAVF